MLFLQEGGVEILSTVRHRIERRHERDAVNKKRPVRAQRLQDKGFSYGDRAGTLLQPDGRFRHARADEENEPGRQRADNKESPPIPVRKVKDEKIRERGEEITPHVTLLQQSAEETAALRWKHFHRHCGAESPLAAHRDAEERAQHEKDREVRRECRQQLEQ